jgi:hypothetical protein
LTTYRVGPAEHKADQIKAFLRSGERASDNEIGQRFGTSHSQVALLRAELEERSAPCSGP